jgi:hypothetical protein
MTARPRSESTQIDTLGKSRRHTPCNCMVDSGGGNVSTESPSDIPAAHGQGVWVRSNRGASLRSQRSRTVLINEEPFVLSERSVIVGDVRFCRQSLSCCSSGPCFSAAYDRTWFRDHHRIDPDESRRMSNARHKAQMRFAKGALSNALGQYGNSNNGQFPTELAPLAPYFKSPMDGSVLEGWVVVSTSSLPEDLRVSGEWAITQKAPINPELDQRCVIGMTVVRAVGDNDPVHVPSEWAACSHCRTPSFSLVRVCS